MGDRPADDSGRMTDSAIMVSGLRKPQIQDVWVLDLQNLSWVRPPGMPTLVALKSGTIGWAPDGTLVMLSVFYDRLTPDYGGQTPRQLVATWRPGMQRWELRTVPQTGQFIVW